MISEYCPRVLHVIDSLAIGGAERMLVEIVNHSSPLIKPFVCITRSDTALTEFINKDIPVFVLKRTKRFDLRGFIKFSSIVKENCIDLIHAYGYSSFSFVLLIKMLGLIKKPLILHLHFGIVETDPNYRKLFMTTFRPWVSMVVGVCENHKAWALRSGIPSERIRVIPNGIDLDPYEKISKDKEIKTESECLQGVLVGGLRPAKGLDLLIEAISIIYPKPNIKISVVGDIKDPGYYQMCHDLIRKHKLEDIFYFLGEQKNIPTILQKMDFALMSSRFESGPLSMIEYLASHLPIIAFNTGNITERAVAFGIQGIVPRNDVAAFAKELQKLLSLSSEDLMSRGELSSKLAFREFDIRMQIPDWISTYQAVLDKK